jgi:hypothetical protein
MRFGMWNFRSFYRAGSLTEVATEFTRYLDLVGMQEFRWNKKGTYE